MCVSGPPGRSSWNRTPMPMRQLKFLVLVDLTRGQFSSPSIKWQVSHWLSNGIWICTCDSTPGALIESESPPTLLPPDIQQSQIPEKDYPVTPDRWRFSADGIRLFADVVLPTDSSLAPSAFSGLRVFSASRSSPRAVLLLSHSFDCL